MKENKIILLKGIGLLVTTLLLTVFFLLKNYHLFIIMVIVIYIMYVAIPFIENIFLYTQGEIDWEVELQLINIEELSGKEKCVLVNYFRLEKLTDSKNLREKARYLVPVCIIIRDYTMEYIVSNRQQENIIIEYVPELSQIYEQPHECLESLLYALKLIREIYGENDFYNEKLILEKCNSRLEENIRKIQKRR